MSALPCVFNLLFQNFAMFSDSLFRIDPIRISQTDVVGWGKRRASLTANRLLA